MNTYIVNFCISSLLMYIGEKKLNKNKRRGMFFIGLSLFCVCITAGLRSSEIGTDIKYYLYPIYSAFVNDSETLLIVCNKTGAEIGFVFFIKLISCFDFHFILFMVELAVALPICCVAYNRRDKTSMTFTWIVFLLTIYCRSLNLMRQSIAISIIILSLNYFENEKYKETICLFFLAALFHISALISIIMFIVSYICKKTKNDKYLILFIIISSTIIFSFGINFFLKYIPKYNRYVATSYQISTLNIYSILKKIIWIIPNILYLMISRKKDNILEYNMVLSYLIFFILDFIFYFMSYQISSAGRIGYYFLYTSYIMFIPQIKNIFKPKWLINSIIILILIIFWYNMTVINNDGEVYPYESDVITFMN